jgi:ureidoglycolate amidohydrolase
MEKASSRQIESWIRRINQFREDEIGTTRLPFSKEEIDAREYVKKEMKKLGMEVSVDSVGNICGRLVGQDSSLPSVWTGSHIDTVLKAGMFDGVAGIVAGMEAVRLICKSNVSHKRDICVRIYTAEESTRFHIGCIGSRTMAGHLSLKEMKQIHDKDHIYLYDLLKENHINLSQYEQIPVAKGRVYGSIELHIEQSDSLTSYNKKIGIVDAICAPSNLIVTIEGKQSHAGGSSMKMRRDAFAALCQIGVELEQMVQHADSQYTTGTIGFVDVMPNAVNVIPGRVVFSVDVRDCDFISKNKVMKKLIQRMEIIAAKRGLSIQIEEKCNDVPMKCSNKIVDILEEECKGQELPYMHTVSGAYHDSLFIGEFAPVGMIFVPSKAGISHSPEEWTEFEDIAAGTDVLVAALLKLANQ